MQERLVDGREPRPPRSGDSVAYRFASTFIAVRRFTDVALMIRSEVGVTAPALPLALTGCVAEPERSVSTSCLEPSLAARDAFCFFVIGQPFRNSRIDSGTYHIKGGRTMPIPRFVSVRPAQFQRCIEEVLPAFRGAAVR